MVKRTEIFLKRLFSIICVILVLAMGLSVSVSAEPTDSFTHNDTQNGTQVSVMSREMYKSTKVINASSLGLPQSFMGLNDLCTDSEGNVYLLVSERSQVVMLNPDYSLNSVIVIKDDFGEVFFDGAQGIYVDKNGDIFICDTNNCRILITDKTGVVKETMEAPTSELLPEDFFYQPYRMAIDEKGYKYIISLGCYYGALTYSPKGEFLGFYGANNINTSALDTLSFLWDKLTQTDEKKSFSTKALPYSFVDLALDTEGYILTCTGKTELEENGVGQIRKLSPGGADILYKRATDGTSETSATLNFLENEVAKKSGATMVQNIVAVDTDADNFIYALDQTYGLIYVYDSECNMLCGFGGGASNSNQKGIFSKAVSLTIHNEAILVADYDNSSVTVFELTEYGKVLKEAQTAYILGDYEGSEALWEKVLSYNRNSQLAYRGLAMAALVGEEYEKALDYAKKGLDYTVYDMAWGKLLSQKINDNFIIIFPACILLIGGLITFFVLAKKKNIVIIKNTKVKVALSTMVHPFDTFDSIKYKNLGSVKIAVSLLVLFYISKMLEKTASGFLFMKSSPTTYNMLYTIIGTVGLVMLWVISNWLVACLADGKGTFKEVLIATTYALIPYIAFLLIRVPLSHILTLSGLSILNGIGVAILIFTFFLLLIAIMAVHEYDFFKFVTTAIVSLFFMLLIVFVLFLVGVLWQQIVEFIKSIFVEIFYR